MKKKLTIKFTVNILILLLIFLAILFLFFRVFYLDFKEKTFEDAKNNIELSIDNFTNKLENKIISYDENSINEYLQNIKNTDFISNVKIEYKRFLFSKDNLIFKANSFSDTS